MAIKPWWMRYDIKPLKHVAYWLRLYRLHPAISAWVFIDSSPLTEADIKRIQELAEKYGWKT